VLAWCKGYAPGLAEVAPHSESVTVWLEPGRSVRGRVFDARTSQGIEGAAVRSDLTELVTVRTGSDGGFDLDDLPARGRVAVLAVAPGYAIREIPLDDSATFVDIGLERGGPLRGRVLWADTRAPVFCATVGASATEPDRSPLAGHRTGQSTETGPDGSFVLEGLEDSLPIKLFAHKGAATTETVLPRRPETAIEIELEWPAWMPTVRVRVLDGVGRPVAGAAVSWSREDVPDLWSTTTHPVRTNCDGIVEISAHERVSKDVRLAAATDDAFGSLDHPVTFAEHRERPLTIVITPTVTLHGKLDLPEHAGHVRVTFWSHDTTGAPIRVSSSAVDADGNFEIAAIHSSRSTVVVEGEAVTPVLHEMSGLGPIRVRVGEATELAGRVTDGDGAGIPDVTVICTPDRRWQTFLREPRWTVRTDDDGRFAVVGLPRCKQTVVARASRRRPVPPEGWAGREPGIARAEHHPGDGDVQLKLE
jgi:hypothetical protein